MRKGWTVARAFLASSALHGAMLVAGAWLAVPSLPGGPAEMLVAIEVQAKDRSSVELPVVAFGPATPSSASDAEPRPAPLVLAGGERVPRPDMLRSGHGGSDFADEAASNLADAVDTVTLDRDVMNGRTRSQVQRLRTSERRASLDDRRATPNPMELSFLATGDGSRRERRLPSPSDPSRGGPVGWFRSTSEGARVGSGPAADGPASPGGARAGTESREGVGVADGHHGERLRRRARVMLARPAVPRDRAAVPALRRARAEDTVDSTQEVASAITSLVQASTAGGRVGRGPGGERGVGGAGSGGRRGPGSTAEMAGKGPGALRTTGPDPRVTSYLAALRRRVDPHWAHAFPDWAIEEGRGGMAVVSLTVLSDGTVRGVRIARSSGIPEFDRNLVAAVRRAAPFGPLPDALASGRLNVNIAFDALNPAVGRQSARR